MTENITVPKGLLRELREGLARVEEVLATLEELVDREGLDRMEKAEGEYEKGKYITVGDAGELRKRLK